MKHNNGIYLMLAASLLSLGGAYGLSQSASAKTTTSSSNADVVIETPTRDELPSVIDKERTTATVSNALQYAALSKQLYDRHKTRMTINMNINKSVAAMRKASDCIKIYEAAIRVPVNKNPSDITCISGLNSDQFDELIDLIIEHRGLTSDNKLHGTGKAFAYIEKEYNINGIYVLAIFTQESGFATRCANTNNFAGIKANRGYRYFETPSDCIYYIGSLLRNKYVDRGLVSLNAIGSVYCETGSWPTEVGNIVDTYLDYMDQIV